MDTAVVYIEYDKHLLDTHQHCEWRNFLSKSINRFCVNERQLTWREMDKDELTTMEKLKGVENWLMWKFQTKVFLNADELFDITLQDKKPKQSQYEGEAGSSRYEKDFVDWKRNDNKAQKIIVRTMAPQPMMYIIDCESAVICGQSYSRCTSRNRQHPSIFYRKNFIVL